MIETGTDFSGVGAFEQAMARLGIDHKTIFACDMDKYARQTYCANYGEPEYFPENVYDREIPEKPLDIYVTSPPCQSFSLAGKRKGEDDDRGVLFYNSHEFIKKNKPRYFVFENVKGLLSDDKQNKESEFGRTFQRWVDFLGGKSVNGAPTIFPHEESVPYHIYHKVLNAKDYGVPQNRERVFIIGIRDDADNNFSFPKKMHLELRLKDILEGDVDEKYYLSDKAINSIILNEDNLQKSKVDPEIASALQTPGNACGIYKGMNAVSVKSATTKGYEVAQEGDSINFSQPNSETRRGRVGKEVAQTLDTACNQGILIKKDNVVIVHNIYGGFNEEKPRLFTEFSPTIRTAKGGGHIPAVMTQQRIRRLTPRECFRLMDFPDSFKIVVSDTQAYRQAGNSIVVAVLAELIKGLN